MPDALTNALTSTYTDENSAKADFGDLYTAPTPHTYLRAMLANEYCISEQTRPYFTAAVQLLRDKNGPAHAVQMLDVGCSYGVGAATVKFGCSFDEMAAFFATRVPENYGRCVEATRLWLHATPPKIEVRVVGLDTSREALRFARDATMIQGALDSNFEDDVLPTDEECAWLRGCNLLVSSGAIGYVTAKTFAKILPLVGQDHAGEFGPLAVFSILRMFDTDPIRQCFEDCDWAFGRVPGVHLPQRRFEDDSERDGILALLEQRGIDPAGLESEGVLYADLFVAAPGGCYSDLQAGMQRVGKDSPSSVFLIELVAIRQEYPAPSGETVVALADVSLEVREGETLCLIGTSGSGKTTLMKTINRLIEPTSGEVRINGKNVQELDPVRLRRGIGYVIQQGGLFPHFTVAANVGLLCRLEGWEPAKTTARVEELLRLVNLDPAQFVDRFPAELSGGQRQRVGVARALALDPEIVLMDEPFAALDPITRDQIHEEFLRLKAEVKKTTVLVTHDMAEAFKLGDRVALLDEGKLIQLGVEADFRERPATPFVESFLRSHLHA